jgi:hypothetical protein
MYAAARPSCGASQDRGPVGVLERLSQCWADLHGERMSIECPLCHLVNAPTALRCDCGYDFESKTLKRSYLIESVDPAHAIPILKRARRAILLQGAVGIACGLTMLALTYSASEGLSIAVFGVASLAWGVIRIVRGWSMVPRNPTSTWRVWF